MDPSEITLIGQELQNSYSSGHDDIQVNIIKSSISYISEPLSHLINCTFQNGIFPESLKIARICPVFKNGDQHVCANYRPISLLPSLSKMFEEIMYKRLVSFLENYNILTNSQYGFRKNHSTYMTILEFYDKISKSVDCNEFAISVFIDLAKAFDTLDHNILCDKLYYYGIHGTALNLFKNYLTAGNSM